MGQSKPVAGEPTTDPAEWLDRHGDALYRYTMLHLSDRSVAEDVVQETLLAALRAREKFAGRSSERTWLIGILKRKIVDHIRKSSRQPVEADFEATAEFVSENFNSRHYWKQDPLEWGRNPDSALQEREFWDVFAFCMSLLPPRLAYAFAAREMDDRQGEEIREALSVTATNLWTLLHRARTRLRRCLESNWFKGER